MLGIVYKNGQTDWDKIALGSHESTKAFNKFMLEQIVYSTVDVQ